MGFAQGTERGVPQEPRGPALEGRELPGQRLRQRQQRGFAGQAVASQPPRRQLLPLAHRHGVRAQLRRQGHLRRRAGARDGHDAQRRGFLQGAGVHVGAKYQHAACHLHLAHVRRRGDGAGPHQDFRGKCSGQQPNALQRLLPSQRHQDQPHASFGQSSAHGHGIGNGEAVKDDDHWAPLQSSFPALMHPLQPCRPAAHARKEQELQRQAPQKPVHRVTGQQCGIHRD
mmetsp:Transcript_38765/g.111951  ORF Transcript_38765/g.111951 Transcript_38765/m.111951 type:complete len:228 (+) Transcript_38765:263-946(+)